MSEPAEKAPNQRTDQERPSAETSGSAKDHDLQEAAERVYRQYGSDLPAFYRNARRERELEKRG